MTIPDLSGTEAALVGIGVGFGFAMHVTTLLPGGTSRVAIFGRNLGVLLVGIVGYGLESTWWGVLIAVLAALITRSLFFAIPIWVLEHRLNAKLKHDLVTRRRYERRIAEKMSAGQPGTVTVDWDLPSDPAAREAIGKFVQQVADSPLPDPDDGPDVFCGVCELPLRPEAPTFSYPSLGLAYPGAACRTCSDKALNEAGGPAVHQVNIDWGDNPVFIDGKKCWRWYRVGKCITMRDYWDCSTMEEFYGHVEDKGALRRWP